MSKDVELYMKKPVVISAVQWTGKNFDTVKSFAGDNVRLADSGNLVVDTLEGMLTATVSDFIIRGVDGEFYPCKEDIFHRTYDRVE